MKNLKRLLERSDLTDEIGTQEQFEKSIDRYERAFTKKAQKVVGKRVALENRIKAMLGGNA